MTFKERSEIAKRILAKQPPVTLEQMRAQAKRVSERMAASTTKHKGDDYPSLKANKNIDRTPDRRYLATVEWLKSFIFL